MYAEKALNIDRVFCCKMFSICAYLSSFCVLYKIFLPVIGKFVVTLDTKRNSAFAENRLRLRYTEISVNSVQENDSCLTLRLLMSYVYGAPILDVSRSHTTTQHSR